MKLALVNGERIEATKGTKAVCQYCGSALMAKCGEIKVNHWAHKSKRNCDRWWENETEWHRSWKNKFPKDWQEIIHTDDKTGEKHIADVKTGSGWAIEFQHSPIKTEERQSRNAFYPKLVWVLDGTRRKRDKPNFHRILDEYKLRSDDPRFICITGPEDCRLIKEWHVNNAPVFLDFQDVDTNNQPIIWFLFPMLRSREAYLWPFYKDKFIELHKNNEFDALMENEIIPFITKSVPKRQAQRIKIQPRRVVPRHKNRRF